ncbi:MAG: DUF1622 domain-containing protein [Dehalococcoidia bacterium]
MQETIEAIIRVIVLLVEVLGGAIILVAVLSAVVRFIGGLVPGRPPPKLREVRLHMARSLLLGLEFLIAAEVLRTILRPSFEEIVILGTVVAIRIALGLDLRFELRHLPREPETLEDDV